MPWLKKIIIGLVFLFPVAAFASGAATWQFTNNTDGFIKPSLINGTSQGIVISASSSLQSFTFGNATGTNATTTNFFTTNLFDIAGSFNPALVVNSNGVGVGSYNPDAFSLAVGCGCAGGQGGNIDIESVGASQQELLEYRNNNGSTLRGFYGYFPSTGYMLLGSNDTTNGLEIDTSSNGIFTKNLTVNGSLTGTTLLLTSSSTLQNFTATNSTTTNATTTGQIAVTGTGANYFAGNVGVGTQSPNYTKFSGNVVTVASSAASGGAFESANTHASAAGLLMDGLSFVQTGNTSASDLRVGMIAGVTQGSTANYYGGGIRLFTRAEGGALTQRWIVNDDGTFCINETTCTGGVFGVSGGANFDNSTTTSATTTSEYDTTLNALTASTTVLTVGNNFLIASATAVSVASTSPIQGVEAVFSQPTVGQGTITVTSSGTGVLGTGTTFNRDFASNYTITADGETHTVKSVSTAAAMTTDAWTTGGTFPYTISSPYGNNNWTLEDRGELDYGNAVVPNSANFTALNLSSSSTCSTLVGPNPCGFFGLTMSPILNGGYSFSGIRVNPTYTDTVSNSAFTAIAIQPTLVQTTASMNNAGYMIKNAWVFGANNTQNWLQLDGELNSQTITAGAQGTFSQNDMNQAAVTNNTSGTATDTEATYFHGTGMTSSFTGGITNAAGVELDNINATNYAYLDLTSAANTIPTGKFGIYENTGQVNYMADNLGIGTTSPWKTLSVNGNVSFAGLNSAAITDNALCLTANNEVVVNAATTCLVSSERFKQNIKALSDETSLQNILKLTPDSYEYKGQTREWQGLVAEQIQKVIPDAVDYNASGTPQSIEYSVVDANLVGAVQAMQEEIETNLPASAKRSVEEDWQWLAIGLLGVWNLWLTFRKRP